jgi:hypothetical protein
MGPFGGLVSIAQSEEKHYQYLTIYTNHIYVISIILLSNIPYQGGGDYRGIYDTGLKRGFYGVYRPFIECPLQDR